MGDVSHVVPDMRGRRATHSPDKAIAALAERQHGVVARRQLTALGLSLDAIDHRVARGRLLRLHRGIYAVGHRRLTRPGVWIAAVLSAGAGAVLSHRSAGALWAIREWSGRNVDVTVPRHRRARPGVAVHEMLLPPDEIDEHEGIPVTTPARTLLDLAAVLDEHRLARACERAEVLRLGSPTSLQDLIERYPRRPGTPKLRRLLDAGRVAATTTANDVERRFLTLLDAENLPRPLVNESLDAIRPDFRWTEQRLIVELDGFETHGTRAAFERDRARDRALRRKAGGSRGSRNASSRTTRKNSPPSYGRCWRPGARSATKAAPTPRPDPRTPAPRSPRAARSAPRRPAPRSSA